MELMDAIRQAIKNEHSASAKAARLLRARHRLALTGTPIENHLGELWSVFEFLNPGVLGRSSLFQRAVSATVGEAGTIDLLAQRLRPFILRRTKQQVASELSAKTELTLARGASHGSLSGPRSSAAASSGWRGSEGRG